MRLQPRILIVDDEPTMQAILEGLLFSEDYRLSFAANGSEAMARLSKEDADVILLDVMMPGQDGFEVCSQIKRNKNWQHIPIILLTALDSIDDLTRGLDSGAEEFLTKPINSQELKARIRSMLRLKRRHDSLAGVLQSKQEKTGMIVHDMRVPLSTIMGFSELLLEKNSVPNDILEDAKIIYNQAHRLNSFIEDLLLMDRAEHQTILNCSDINIINLIRQVEQDAKIISRSKKMEFEVQLTHKEAMYIWADEALLRRVLDNLISNAFKYSQPGDRITLRLHNLAFDEGDQEQKRIRIEVVDEGPGIPIDYRERIFGKFEVIDSVEDKNLRIGLGLAFCKIVIEAHGGSIKVEPNVPQGSVFIIEL